MATGKRYYWMKLKESFMTSDTIDYFMEQPDGANYVVLYQLLCLKTINTGGRLSRQIGEIIIPYDVSKIQRDCKWFSADTVRVALKLYQAVGLIYEDVDGTLVLADHKNLVGSETDYALQKKIQRESTPQLPLSSVDIVHSDVHQNVHTDIEIDIRDRDKSLDNRDKEKEKKKADAFSDFAGTDSELLSTLRDFEQMRNKIKKPLTPRAKTMLINKLSKEFRPEDWITVLEKSIAHCWQDIYPLKERNEARQQKHSAIDDLKELHELFSEEDGT
jgi:hypothetical protein